MFQDKDLPVDFADGAYRLTKLIGTGGMAAVYSANVDLDRFDFATLIAFNEQKVGTSRAEREEHLESRRARWRKRSTGELRAVCDEHSLPYPHEGRIAVKILLPHLANQSERFVTEWKAMVALSHPNLVQVYAGGWDEYHGMHYYAMELLEDIVDVGPLSTNEQLDVFRQAAAGLQYLHESGLVHRDIKPANIVTTRGPDGLRARVTDLGIAKDITRTQGLTMTNSVMGTPFYMAPEQANSARAVTHLSDIYALGATLYYWISGRTPYQGLSLYVVLAKLATGDRPEPVATLVGNRVPEGLCVLIDHMMDPDPAKRPSDMRTVVAIADQLKRMSRTQLIRALTPSTELPVTLVHDAPRGDTNRIVASTHVPVLDLSSTSDRPSATLASSAVTTPTASPPRHGTALVGAGALAIALAAGGWYLGLFGPAPASPRAVEETAVPVADDREARVAFARTLATADARRTTLVSADEFDLAIAELRELAAAAAAIGASGEVRDRIVAVERERARRADAVEAAIEAALAKGTAGVAEHLAMLERVDAGHSRLASFRKRLAQCVADERARAELLGRVADLVARIEQLLPAKPDAAAGLIDELTALDDTQPRLGELRERLARARELAIMGDAERARALAARQAWLDERTPWPDALLQRHGLSAPPSIELAETGLAEADAMRQAGQRESAARRFEQAASQFDQGREAFAKSARTKAHAAFPPVAEAMRTWEQLKRRLALDVPAAVASAEAEVARASVFVDQEQPREALQACGAAEPVLARAIADAVEATGVRAHAAAAAWAQVYRDRGLADEGAFAKDGAAKVAQGDAATSPVARVDAWLAGVEAYGKAVAEATYVPSDLPFALPKGWYYVRRNAEGYHEVQARDGATMIWVDRGRFLRGGADVSRLAAVHGTPAATFSDELPEHEIELDGMFVDKHEVTNARYARFLAAQAEWRPGGPKARAFRGYLSGWSGAACPAGSESHPVVCVPWEAAAAYCAWAEKRLPTEAEWERAARGTDGRPFPWGKSFDLALCNSASHWVKKLILTPGQQRTMFLEGVWQTEGNRTLTMPVGSFPGGSSPIGALDLAGNAMEWCADAYAPDYYLRAARTPSNPVNTEGSTLRAVRGGSWMDPIAALRTTARQGTLAEICDRALGFRGARTAPRR